MDSLRFVEVFVTPRICQKTEDYPMQGVMAEMKSLEANSPQPESLTREELRKDINKRQVLLNKAKDLARRDKRLILVCQKRGALNYVSDDLPPCPFCQEEYSKYMKHMDALERTGEIQVQRGEDVEKTLTCEGFNEERELEKRRGS